MRICVNLKNLIFGNSNVLTPIVAKLVRRLEYSGLMNIETRNVSMLIKLVVMYRYWIIGSNLLTDFEIYPKIWHESIN